MSKLDEVFEIPESKKNKKDLKKVLDKEKEDFVKSIQDLISSKMPIEPPKRKYERKKPSKEKSIDDEYKDKLRRNLEIARSKRKLKPKDTFEKSIVKTEEEIKEPVEKVIEKPIEKVVDKVIEKPIEKVIEKPHLLEKDTFEKSIVKNKVSPKEESFDNTFVKSVKVVEKSIENKSVVEERYSTYNKPPWFKKPSWMK